MELPDAPLPWSAVLPIDSIKVTRDERQRRELVGIEELADSIRRRGLLQPIVITRDLTLVAGERRITACRSLGHDFIRVTYSDELDPGELQALELEENIKRVDLPWKDSCRAISAYHAYRRSTDPTWNQVRTAEALGLPESDVSERLLVAKELAAGNRLVEEAPRLSTARGIVKRQAERRAAAETSALVSMAAPAVAKGSSEAPTPPPQPSGTGFILNVDFLEWARAYDGDRFNLIHCDFPYGVGMHKSDQGSGASHGTYEDTPDVYWALVDSLLNHLDNFCEESAHLVFWFSMDYYQSTLEALSSQFRVNPFPLVWHKSDGAGILPDPNRGPRRTYETAFLASRGDRKIVKPVTNSVASGIQRGRHMSEKPQFVLQHYFRMLVDEHTALLDPTCGSGSAVRAAYAAGAGRYLGLELNPEFADHADEAMAELLSMEEIPLI